MSRKVTAMTVKAAVPLSWDYSAFFTEVAPAIEVLAPAVGVEFAPETLETMPRVARTGIASRQ